MLEQQQRDSSAAAPDRVVESARYALLRRLAHAMRHDMVVHLQPIGMIAELMERRLQSAAPDLAQVHESMGRINRFSRAAVQSCLDVVSWMAPDEQAVVALDAGVRDCLSLLRSSLNFGGFTLKDEIGAVSFQVDRAGLRHVLPACLLALTDCAGSPAEVVLSCDVGSPEFSPARPRLTVSVRPADGPARAADKPYRLLQWHEVEALARAEGIELQRSGDCAQLTLAAAASPPATSTRL